MMMLILKHLQCGGREQTTRPKCNKCCQKGQHSGIWLYYIWNPYEKCIQKSPNMPGIGSLIREIDVTISEILETNILFCSVKPMPAF